MTTVQFYTDVSGNAYQVARELLLFADPTATIDLEDGTVPLHPAVPPDYGLVSVTTVLTVPQLYDLFHSLDVFPNSNAIQRKKDARSTAKVIPNWATWSQTDLQTWYDANISATQINAAGSLATLKPIIVKQSAAILALGQMLIALRDQLWPDLQDR